MAITVYTFLACSYEHIEYNLLLKNVWLEINVGYTYENRKKQKFFECGLKTDECNEYSSTLGTVILYSNMEFQWSARNPQ